VHRISIFGHNFWLLVGPASPPAATLTTRTTPGGPWGLQVSILGPCLGLLIEIRERARDRADHLHHATLSGAPCH